MLGSAGGSAFLLPPQRRLIGKTLVDVQKTMSEGPMITEQCSSLLSQRHHKLPLQSHKTIKLSLRLPSIVYRWNDNSGNEVQEYFDKNQQERLAVCELVRYDARRCSPAPQER